MGWKDDPIAVGSTDEDVPPSRQIRTGVMTAQDDPGALGAFTLSAGRTADKLVSGTKQLGKMAMKKYYESQGNLAEVERINKELAASGAEQASADEAYAPVEEAHPIATGLGGGVPYALPMGGIARSAAGSAMLGGLEYGTPGERMQRAGTMGILGAGGAAVGQLASGILSPGARVESRNLLTSPISEIVDRMRGFKNPDAGGQILGNMEARGYRPSVSEIGGSTTARQAEDYLSRAPGSSGVMAGQAAGNQRVINTAAAEAIGERARNLSGQVLGDASERIGKTFEAVAALPGRPINLSTAGNAATEALRLNAMRPVSSDPVLAKVATQLQMAAKHNGRISGEMYNVLRSDLSSAANAAHRAGNGAVGRLYDNLLEAVDGAAATSLERAGHGDLSKSLTTARSQYANLMSLERGRTVTAGGDVSPQALGGVMRQKYPRQFREGRMEGNPLFDIARYGEVYPPTRAGSQTFERQAIQDIAEAPAAIATGAERPGMGMLGLATAPFNYAGAQYMTSPLARFLSRRGMLGQPTLSSTGGVLADVISRDIAAGQPGSMGILSAENWE